MHARTIQGSHIAGRREFQIENNVDIFQVQLSGLELQFAVVFT